MAAGVEGVSVRLDWSVWGWWKENCSIYEKGDMVGELIRAIAAGVFLLYATMLALGSLISSTPTAFLIVAWICTAIGVSLLVSIVASNYFGICGTQTGELQDALNDIVGGSEAYKKLPTHRSEIRWDRNPPNPLPAPVFVFEALNQGNWRWDPGMAEGYSQERPPTYQQMLVISYHSFESGENHIFMCPTYGNGEDEEYRSGCFVHRVHKGINRATALALKTLVTTGKCECDPLHPETSTKHVLGLSK